MTYPEAIRYLESFIDYEKALQYPYAETFKLERIKQLLDALGNPQDALKCIQVAGTKGKGSTCAFVAYILRQAQFKVGLYTSPHLSDFKERIRILSPQLPSEQKLDSDGSPLVFEGMISDDEIVAIIERLRPQADKFNAHSKYGALSFFEVYTAIAFIYFRDKKVDFCVLETGLGGRLDATNSVNSLIAALTPISYEHTQYLGDTLTEIAFEKAGIIKSRSKLPQLIAITAPQEKEVMEIFRRRCGEQGAALYEIGKDIIIENNRPDSGDQCFAVRGLFGELADLKIRLKGSHQIINAALAAAVVLAMRKFYHPGLSLKAIKDGLYNTLWPGRFEIISGNRLVVLDGAQNASSAQALLRGVKENFPDRRIILVLGVCRDKDIKGICRALIPISQEVILTQVDNPRAADINAIREIIRHELPDIKCRINGAKKVSQALDLAAAKAKQGDLILITGSLFLVGQARELLNNRQR
ncbi:MAG: folylpolyglutamate synthase/dihydrofolate synthase family protein [Candidatus Omnitrophota bacterium]